MDQRPIRNAAPPRRAASGSGFTTQQALILGLVAILGLAAVGLAALLLFSPPAGLARATAQATSRPLALAPVATAQVEGALPSPMGLPAGCAERNNGVTHAASAHVIDGGTIQASVDGKVVPVGYAGIEIPGSGPLNDQAASAAREILEGQPVLLVKDASDQDASGRLLRYVFSGGRFLNAELLKRGLARLAAGTPDQACAAVLHEAEQRARAGRLGIWAATPVPTSTFMPFVTLDVSHQAPCDCSSRPVCADFLTHADAQACFNACNDYNSRLDDNHDGIACPELP